MAAKPKPDASRADLEALRDHLWARLQATDDPFATAQLAAQHRGVVNDLAAMAPAEKVVTTRDELKAKRAARAQDRGAASAVGASAGRGSKPRGG